MKQSFIIHMILLGIAIILIFLGTNAKQYGPIDGGVFGGSGLAIMAYIIIRQVYLMVHLIVQRMKKVRYEDDLLKYKKLFDENILTQSEYDKKVQELKNKIL